MKILQSFATRSCTTFVEDQRYGKAVSVSETDGLQPISASMKLEWHVPFPWPFPSFIFHCTMDEWSTREFGEWEGKNTVRTNARRSEIVQWSEK